LACSADGSKLAATAVNDTGLFLTGKIYIWRPAPNLNSKISANGLTISWPQEWTGYSLQENSEPATTNWTYVPMMAALTNGQNQVLISPTNGRDFYRLEYH
jgi:hypothetical protein